MHKLLSFSLLICCFAYSSPAAPAGTGSLATPIFSSMPAGPCTLPAPASFYVIDVGTTYISVGWSPVSGAVQYRMKVKNLTTGVNVSDQLIGSLIFTQTGLVAGDNYEFKIYPICAGGVQSESFARLEQRTIIIDLILQASNYNSTPQYNCSGGYSFNTTPVTCNFSYQTDYEFWLEVRPTTGSQLVRYRALVLSNGNVSVGIVPATGNYESLPSILTQNELGTSPSSPWNPVHSEKVFILSLESVICSFTMSKSGTTGTLTALPSSGYEIWILNPSLPPSAMHPAPGLFDAQGSDDGVVNERSAPTMNTDATLVINPFSTTLEVLRPATEQPVTLYLFGTDGRLVLTQQFAGDAVRCLLPTAELAAGLYFLRVETAGMGGETFKVVKTE